MVVRADSERDFHEFVTARSGDLLRLAQVLTADRHAAEDLVQTTLLKVWRSWPRVRGTEDPVAYVRKVMVNTATHGWRRRWRGEIPTAELPDPPGQDTVDPVGERDALVRALRRLPPGQRAAVALRYFADLDDRAIADSLACSVSTARSQISRGLATLRVRTQQDALSAQEMS
jgi:RNA polymerase sigma-70 factor (sigma-E family)